MYHGSFSYEFSDFLKLTNVTEHSIAHDVIETVKHIDYMRHEISLILVE